MPWFKRGAHDRIFNTMLNGSVSFTDSSEYLDNYLKDDINSEIYDLKDLDSIPDKVNALLSDEDKMQTIADNGFKMALDDHTWAHRAAEIIKLCKEL